MQSLQSTTNNLQTARQKIDANIHGTYTSEEEIGFARSVYFATMNSVRLFVPVAA